MATKKEKDETTAIKSTVERTNAGKVLRAQRRGSQILMINRTLIIHNRNNTIPTKQTTPNAMM